MPLRPCGLEAVQVKSVAPAWLIASVILVTVSAGLTPVQFGFGQPACWPDTVDGADKTAGLVVKVTVPFLMALPGIVVGAVTGPTNTRVLARGDLTAAVLALIDGKTADRCTDGQIAAAETGQGCRADGRGRVCPAGYGAGGLATFLEMRTGGERTRRRRDQANARE